MLVDLLAQLAENERLLAALQSQLAERERLVARRDELLEKTAEIRQELRRRLFWEAWR